MHLIMKSVKSATAAFPSRFDDTDALTDTRIKEQVLPAMKKLSGQLSALLGWEEAL